MRLAAFEYYLTFQFPEPAQHFSVAERTLSHSKHSNHDPESHLGKRPNTQTNKDKQKNGEKNLQISARKLTI